ncbi:MAG: Vitamin B12 transporter BtuB [Chroococcidiopsis sp. SAG 2025]|uniref:TonB-dependent siderophore receptor n=1 Tax=Chroococcidiopsis sp. SAG 2025 TaxID=171389 RepID=UPI002936FC71|nr:TonB-dependent siderophore receptor [Chroococcidiopsis sp. SAG 2025]MDV2998232.1 Vitamin B12 transporter BtuB [Chroococcidiopsis sp. SAG 2025]
MKTTMVVSKVWAIVQWAFALGLLSAVMNAGMPAKAQEAIGLPSRQRIGRIDQQPEVERDKVLELRNTSADRPERGGVSAPQQSFSSVLAVPQLSEMEQPTTTVGAWVAQIEASLVQITGVRVEATEAGLQVMLETLDGSLEVPKTRVVGKALIADIPNAAIAQEFSQANPIEGIALVSVTDLPGDRVRVAITGTDAPPTAKVTAEAQGLVLAVTLRDTGDVAEEDAIQEEIVVTGEQDEGYNPSNATTATRTDTPLRDIPQSIQVVPRQVLEDRDVQDLNQAVETVSGVVSGGGQSGAPAGSRIIRGFNQAFDGGAANFRNGFRDSVYTDLTGIGTVEQVEVLKGPASVLFGALEPGGVVNVVTRQPLAEPYYKFELEVGNYGFYQPSIDFSGPLDDNGDVLYRFIASYQHSDSYQPFVDLNLTTIAPSLTFKLGDRTKLDLYYEYVHFFANPFIPQSLIFSDGDLVRRDLYTGYPALDLFNTTTQRLGYTLNHNFSENWRLRNNLAVTWTDSREKRAFPLRLVDDRFLELFGGDANGNDTENYFGQIDLLGKFNTGSISHQLLAGFDFNHFFNPLRYSAYSIGSLPPDFSVTNLPPLDLLNPNYNILLPSELVPLTFSDRKIRSYGIFLQDQIAFSDRWKLLVGGRYDWVSDENENLLNETNEPVQNDGAFSPRIGLVYQPSDTVSLYASYSRSFNPSQGFNPDGRAFEPTKGTQYEAGVKADFLESRLSTTLAAYHLTKTNVTTDDPNNPNFSIQVGEQRSRGIELDITGEILPGWNVTAAYAYTNAEVTEDNTTPVGNRLVNVPDNQASLWTTYEIQKGSLQGLGFGLGLFYIGERQGDLDNSFQLDSYFRTDAALFYRRDRFKAAINVRNLFDIDYVAFPVGGRVNVLRGEPFTITGSISWEF